MNIEANGTGQLGIISKNTILKAIHNLVANHHPRGDVGNYKQEYNFESNSQQYNVKAGLTPGWEL